MQKVIGVNLNGVAYQVEEGGYQALVVYLDRAHAQLADNPDRAEILADLEQAIGEKCRACLTPHKTVVTEAEIARILSEMGPVDGTAGAEETAGAGSGRTGGATGAGSAPRRLYQIREGAMLSGVCNGLGAYFNLDPTIVRIIFVLLALVTKGVWILVYLVLMFVVPYATTSEERAAAHGERFTAQDLIDRAKRQYAEFKDSKDWKREWRRTRLEWKRQWRRLRWQPPAWGGPGGPAFWRAGNAWTMAVAPLFAIVNVALLVLLAYVLISLATAHAVFGYALPAGLPLWAAILIAIAIYTAIASPFHHVHRATWYGYPSGADAWLGPWIGLFWLAAIAFSIWYGYHYVPQVREFIQQLPAMWQQIVQR